MNAWVICCLLALSVVFLRSERSRQQVMLMLLRVDAIVLGPLVLFRMTLMSPVYGTLCSCLGRWVRICMWCFDLSSSGIS